VPWSGRVWRYVPRDAHPLHFGYILDANGRWNRPGVYGCLYLATGKAGAHAEREKYARAAALGGLPFGPHDLVSIDLTVTDRALDLTDSTIQRSFGVTTAQLRADGTAAYELCRRTADLARAQGDFVLFVPSSPLEGAANVIIYPEVSPANCRLEVGPDRIPIA
jgi:RES domain-containing protein